VGRFDFDEVYACSMKAAPERAKKPVRPKRWVNPVKNQPAKNSTLDIKGDFQEFTDLMRRIVINKSE
jgi:hypothetical protein